MPQQQYNKETDTEKQKEDWMNAKWRPMMGWMYMFVCLFDFVMAPVAWTSIQALFHGGITTQWQPLTLQGGGLFHVAMGAVIGISAYGRTKEKLEGVAGGGQPMGTTYIPPGGMQGGFGNQPGGFGTQQNGFGGMTNGGFNASQGGAPTFGQPQSGFSATPGSFGTPATNVFNSTTPSFRATPVPTFAPPASTPALNAQGKKLVPFGAQPEL